MKRAITVLLALVGILFITTFTPLTTSAAIPLQITYQGQLTDTEGNPVPDGDYEISFALYGAGGSLLWDEQQSVVVTGGIYTVQLGAVSPLDVTVFSGDTVYLGVAIYNPDTTTWEILSPRQRLTSTAYAFQAENTQSLEGYGSADFAPALHEHSGDDITSGIIDQAHIDPDIARDSEITWSHLSGIPTDIADGDQVGITAETDPTITDPTVKDGVSWSELSGIPTGFADGVDNVGLAESSDYGRSGVASTLYEGTTALNTKYVGKSGSQTITNGNLTVNTPYGMGTTAVTGVKGSAQSDTYGFGVIGEAGGSEGYGVFGGASGSYGRGVYGEASGLSGKGVYGEATNTESGVNYGGYFFASGIAGYGVFGGASGSGGRGVCGSATNIGDVTNCGGYFTASGSTGYAVYGEETNTGNFTNYGGFFIAPGSYGRGVYGEATKTGNYTNHGGFFIANGNTGRGVYAEGKGTSGRGVYGRASNDGDVTNYGGYFQAMGTHGMGILAEALSTEDATNYGGHFTAHGTLGRGIYGEGANTGEVRNFGGYFRARGRDGWGVYAEALGTNGIGVYGKASNVGIVRNYGGYFVVEGYYGTGVYSSATGTAAYGVHSEATGSYGVGVYGNGGLHDFYAENGSYSPFTGSHEVRLAEEMPIEIRAGMIVSVTGRAEARVKDDGEISLSSTLPTVALATKAMDKAVFGVFVSECPLPEDHWYEAEEGERFGAVNALGEGRVLVTNITGEIEAGDYITTSAIPGYGQKQDDDVLHSYTLGKAIETIDWESVTETIEHNGVVHKAYLIAVAYTSG